MLPTIARRTYRPTYLSDFFSSDFDNYYNGRRDETPAVNIKEEDREFAIEMAVPGMKKDEISIEIEKDVLMISSNRNEEKKEDFGTYSRREFGTYSFCRSFKIPESVKSDKIKASFDNGILNVTLPKSEETATLNRTVKIA